MPPEAASSSPKFVVFEGGDESGKSTHARWVAERRAALYTFEPHLNLDLRDLLLDTASANLNLRTEALLFAADRAQHVATVIRPALDAGQDVVCDRYIGSSLAYQSYGRGLALKDVFKLSEFATDGLLPDLVLLLNISYETYAERLAASQIGVTRFDQETADFHRRVLDGYAALAQADPQRWAVIDGEQPLAEVRRDVAATLNERLGWKL